MMALSSGDLVDSTVCVADTSKLCMVCEEAPKQYKCPRCDYFTCSLKCCKQHKIEDILQTKDSALRTLSLNCGGRSKENYSKDRSYDKEDSIGEGNLRNILCTPVQQLQSYPPAVKRLAKAPHMLLKPESPSSQNNNIGEQSSSSSAISITEESLVTISLPVVEESKTISEILADFLSLRAGNSVYRHALRTMRPDSDKGVVRCLVQHLPSPGGDPIFCDIPLSSTLKSALEGRTVIEYPTLIFGSIEHTKKLNFRIVALQDTDDGAAKGDGDRTEGEKEGEGEKSIGLSISQFPSSSSGKGSNKKRGAVEAEGEGFEDNVEEGREGGLGGVGKRVRISDTEAGSVAVAEREGAHSEDRLSYRDPVLEDGVGEEEEEEEEEEDAEEVFLSALKEFEGKDIEALKAFIHSSES